MRAALALLLVAAAPARPVELAHRVAAAIRVAHPDATVTIVDPHSLTAKLKGQEPLTINTDRVDQYCATSSAAECEDERAAFVRNMLAALVEHYDRFDPSQLRVILRADEYVASYRELLAQNKRGAQLITRPAAPGVTAMLAADFPTTTRMVDSTDLDKLGLTNETALALGEKQTIAALPPVPRLSEIQGKLIAQSGYDYGASVMLLPERWHDLADASQGTLFVAIPSDGEVLVGTATSAELPKLRAAVAESLAHARRAVSGLVYRWSPQGWVVAE